jgi:hypothetical protein
MAKQQKPKPRPMRERVAGLVYYGTGDEAYEMFQRGVRFLRDLEDCPSAAVLREKVFAFLKRHAELSRGDYVANYGGDPDDPKADKVTGDRCWC